MEMPMDFIGQFVSLSFLIDFLKRSLEEFRRRDHESYHWTHFIDEEEAQGGLGILARALFLFFVDEDKEAWKDMMLVLSKQRNARAVNARAVNTRAVNAPRLYQKAPKIVNVKVSPRPIHQPR